MSYRFIAAIILSPLIAPLALSFSIVGPEMFKSIRSFNESISLIALMGIPLSYTFLILFGTPIYWFLKKYKMLSFGSIVSCGTIFPMGILLLFLAFSGMSHNDFNAILAVGLCGFSVSVIFWLISYGVKWRA